MNIFTVPLDNREISQLLFKELSVSLTYHNDIILQVIIVFIFRSLVPKRKGSSLTEVNGIFPGATIKRGSDWPSGNNNGIIIARNRARFARRISNYIISFFLI